MHHRHAAAAVLIAAVSCGTEVRAQNPQAEYTFWSSVEARNTPDEYKAYLAQYPTGMFAPLARIRLQAVSPTPAPEPEADTPHISVVPPAGRVGQTYTVDCSSLPEGGSSADAIIVVPAGSPSMEAVGWLTSSQIAFSQYTANCKHYNGMLPGFGPLPPGRWEFRWMTTLYNVQHRLEMKAKADLVVR